MNQLVKHLRLNLVASAIVLTACVGSADLEHETGEEISTVTQSLGEPNDIAIKVAGLAEFEGKTIHFAAGESRDTAKIVNGAASALLEEAVSGDLFGAFVYAYFSPNAASDACSDVGPVLSGFVSTAGLHGEVVPLTIRQDPFNQFDCAKLTRTFHPGIRLARDARPNFADLAIRASGLRKYEGKEVVFVARNRLGRMVNSAVINQGKARVILKNAIDTRTFGAQVKAYINMDGRGGHCAPRDPAWEKFVSSGPDDRIPVGFHVSARNWHVVTPVNCAGKPLPR